VLRPIGIIIIIAIIFDGRGGGQGCYIYPSNTPVLGLILSYLRLGALAARQAPQSLICQNIAKHMKNVLVPCVHVHRLWPVIIDGGRIWSGSPECRVIFSDNDDVVQSVLQKSVGVP